LEKLAAVGGDEKSVARLQRAAELAEGSHVVGGIEDQDAADFGQGEDGRE